ncbi:hypothetical protein JCM33374_g2449 [Metschnikowia sp. JCM 33374]|nr:hypothetical protein JCM33374_g2449 [Metschnikowia sp. JCM 33374]
MYVPSKYTTSALYLAGEHHDRGTFLVSPIGNDQVPRSLVIEDNFVVSSDWKAVFTYSSNQTLASAETKQHLGLNDAGQLVMRDQPMAEFSLVTDTNGANMLAFNGNNVFQVCGDDRIAHESNCEGGKNVTIAFDQFL